MLEAPVTLKDRTLFVAASQVGKMEQPIGSNWGPDIKMYLLSVGINFPAPWCMAFVYWCTAHAAELLSVQNPLIRTGGVMNQWYNMPASMKIMAPQQPQAGDIFIMEFAHGNGHTGFVESVADGFIHTIEGNSNEDGSREGFEVCRHVRPISSIHGFIRLS